MKPPMRERQTTEPPAADEASGPRAARRTARPAVGFAPVALLLSAMLIIASCTDQGGGGPSAPSSGGPGPTEGVPGPTDGAARASPSPPVGGPVTTPEEAAALVIASDPRFADVRPYDPDLIGQAAWWTAEPAADGYIVIIRIGWGDCQAGCIDQHTWRYSVTTAGEVELLSEEGSELPPGGVGDETADTGGVTGRALAGPTCPVVQDPPDPSCADRPVAGAVIVVRDARGREVARVTTAADGLFTLELPGGTYTLEPQPVEGLMGTAAPVEVTVEPGEAPVLVDLPYDTGIR